MYATELKKIVKVRYVHLLECLSKGEKSMAQISKETGFTSSHTIKIIKLLEKAGIIITRRKGRERLVKLTIDGWQVYHLLIEILPTEKDSLSFFSPKDS